MTCANTAAGESRGVLLAAAFAYDAAARALEAGDLAEARYHHGEAALRLLDALADRP